jgi:hypothetical protein
LTLKSDLAGFSFALAESWFPHHIQKLEVFVEEMLEDSWIGAALGHRIEEGVPAHRKLYRCPKPHPFFSHAGFKYVKFAIALSPVAHAQPGFTGPIVQDTPFFAELVDEARQSDRRELIDLVATYFASMMALMARDSSRGMYTCTGRPGFYW